MTEMQKLIQVLQEMKTSEVSQERRDENMKAG